MASGTPATTASDPSPLDVPSWLKTLPLAPEYHPTLAEFQDPIAYILKVEKEASSYGICKIVPPLPAPPRKTALANLNRSFATRNGAGAGGPKKASPTFTTRHQQIGFCPRRPRPVQKPVWQSGEQYTLQQFEAKAKQFERTQLKRSGRKNGGSFSELEVETLFWNAAVDKPIQVEYANDMPGSGFAPQMQSSMRKWQEEDAGNVGDTAWNMRGVSRAKGSLLKFMKEEIPGVTSPMVYVAMMFSWFAWHVEDHELHSLSYLHMGAGKTWYGVPRDAGIAFEEVVRVQGYGGEVNPLVTFAILGEKTTVMSPEVLVGTGIPCCRLVQNVGDFVVTFPGAYHCGFSHGFNCGEASNIATPEWLNVAKEAAIRRASINYPPMVSHFQLLYDLALSLWSRMPLKSAYEPRSSRLKDKLKGEGEMMIKELFVQNVVENNSLLDTLLVKGSSCVVLPQNKFNILPCSNSHVRSLMKIKSRSSLGLCSREEALEASRDMPSNDFIIDSDAPFEHPSGLSSAKGNLLDVKHADSRSFTSDSPDMDSERPQGEGLLDQGLLSCVACGILSFACVAVVQPTDAAAKYLMSADCSIFNDLSVGLETICGNAKANIHEHTACSGRMDNNYEVLDDNMAHSSSHHVQVSDRVIDVAQDRVVHKGASALDLLASAYGELSDSEEENIQPVGKLSTDEIDSRDASPPICSNNVSPFENNLQNQGAFKEQVCPLQRGSNNERTGILGHPSSRLIYSNKSDGACDLPNTGEKECQETVERSSRNHYENSPLVDPNVSPIHRAIDSSTGAKDFVRTPLSAEVSSGQLHNDDWNTDSIEHDQSVREVERPKLESEYGYELAVMPTEHAVAAEHPNKYYAFLKNSSTSLMHSPDKDSSRMHVFCLEHALEVEKQLQPLGGSSMMVLCHPDYPLIEAQAKIAGEELGITYVWKEIHFKDATEEDQQTIRTALEDEEAIPTNSDWAVKMGVNLYYSANLSKSPLYSKQMPYNSVIYKAFGRSSSGSSPGKPKVFERRRGRKKKLVVAGKWCGKVWMSNQVHPYLAHKNDPEEQEIANKFKDEDMMLLEIDACTAEQAKTPTRNTLASSSSASRTYNRKRKISQENLHVKKAKYAQPDNDNTSAEMVENSSGRCRRFLRSGWKQPPSTPSPSDREKTPQFSESSLDENTGGGPSTRLRSRSANKLEGVKTKTQVAEKFVKKKGKKTLGRNPAAASNEGVMKKGKNNLGKNLAAANDEGTQRKGKKNAGKSPAVADDDMADYPCDVEGCAMSFSTKHDLVLHKRNICPVKGCGKKFFSHKYLVQHRRVHMDDRPLKCPWKGCRMTFKWAWARTEHIRVHTGDRPYICMASGCGQTFRFVSDFSRHKRKTGHVSKRGRR